MATGQIPPAGLSPARPATSIAARTIPTLFCESFLRCLSPCPGGPSECTCLVLPQSHRPSPTKKGSASRFLPRTRLFTGRLARLQLFRYVQASQFARLPDRSYRCKFSSQGSRDFYIRAERASLPSHASDLLPARLQAIGGTRTFTSQDSQPCRLLTNDADVSTVPPKSRVEVWRRVP